MNSEQHERTTNSRSLLFTLNSMFHARLLRIASAVVTAVDCSNSWFFCKAGIVVHGNHFLLEQGAHASGRSPVVLFTADPFPSSQSSDQLPDTGVNTVVYHLEYSRKLLRAAKPSNTSTNKSAGLINTIP